MADRLLRNQGLRATLYFEADGKCGNCGVVLEDNWHADHVIPWSASKRTNVFEMQALCPSCNTSKGARMNTIPEFTIKEEAFRRGQRRAYTTIIDRVRAGERYTAVVLPTRYGKTDVMRVTGLRLWRDRLVSNMLIMAPDRFLRDQTTNQRKMQDSLQRYGIPSYALSVYPVEEGKLKLSWMRNCNLIAITTQKATLYIKELTQWVDHMRDLVGVPPIVFVDEAHTGSDENRWGETMGLLGDAGAFVVLLTATAHRTDGRPIPGFKLIPEKTGLVTVRRPNGHGQIDIWEGTKTYYRLEAHHVTTFQDAWNVEDPSPLCKISRQPFDITLSDLDEETGELQSRGKISELSERETRATLTRAVRNVKIIHQACEILVKEINRRRGDPNGRDTAAIVFVGNDQPEDEETNGHAHEVKNALGVLDRSLHCKIATSTNENDAAATIEAFGEGDGDILIVKQMASRGLDIPRLKVCLDLSTIRTATAFIQRITRVCTVWEHGPSPEEAIGTAVYIAPDDCLSRALFQRFITDEHGEAATDDLEWVGSVDVVGGNEPPPVAVPDNVVLPEMFEDSQKIQAPGSMLPITDRFYDEVPEMARFRSKPEFANILKRVGITETSDELASPTPVAAGPIQNIQKEFDLEVDSLYKVAREITNKRFLEVAGHQYVPKNVQDGQLYGRLRMDVWNELKDAVGMSRNLDIRDFEDIAQVKRMRHIAEGKRRNG